MPRCIFLFLKFRFCEKEATEKDERFRDKNVDIPKSDEGRDFTSGSIAELLGMD